MNTVILNEKSLAIAYDASLMDTPGVEFFSPDFWQSRDALKGTAAGRGNTWFVDAPFGKVVLRHFLRGGWASRVSRNSYFFTTISRSRPFREYNLLAALHEQGLPVSRPVAAICEHHGFRSTGAIMTAHIPVTKTLADILLDRESELASEYNLWARVGECIRKFHDAGVWHADLNACNILLDSESRVFLIDFDRARFTPGKAVNGEGNLNRLQRSLRKHWPDTDKSTIESTWAILMDGYHA